MAAARRLYGTGVRYIDITLEINLSRRVHGRYLLLYNKVATRHSSIRYMKTSPHRLKDDGGSKKAAGAAGDSCGS